MLVKITKYRGDLLDRGLLIGKTYDLAAPVARALLDDGGAEAVEDVAPDPMIKAQAPRGRGRPRKS